MINNILRDLISREDIQSFLKLGFFLLFMFYMK